MSLKKLFQSYFLLSAVLSAVSAELMMKGFKRLMTCDNVTKATSVTVLTKSECAVKCAQHDSCKSFSVTTTVPLLCYLHNVYLKAGVCEDQYRHFNDLDNPCFHGGDYDVSNNTCVCYGGYVGDLCERLMQDCSEGFLYSYYASQDANFLCHPNGAPKPIKVHCDMTWGGRTLITTQASGNENFTRTWEEYKTGFGRLSGDHWLGNDNIHYITSGRTHYLLVELWTPGSDNKHQIAQRFYEDFLVGPEVDDYRMTFSSTLPNPQWVQQPAECLVRDTPFSTPDVDRSGAAGVTQSGFWFTNPLECNPTGQLKQTDASWGGDMTDVFWKDGIDGEAVNKIHVYMLIGHPSDHG